jgi:hypothetical protein
MVHVACEVTITSRLLQVVEIRTQRVDVVDGANVERQHAVVNASDDGCWQMPQPGVQSAQVGVRCGGDLYRSA